MGLVGWLSGSSSTTTEFLEAADELAALREAVAKAAWVMNDEITRAETELSTGKSPFHQLGYGACLFWQAALGFDKEIMARARTALAQAESVATDHLKRASKDPSTAFQSKIYPAGAEYSLCQAQCQLLGAILGILSDNWTDGLKGVNKLRKGYITLKNLTAAEQKYVKSHAPAAAQPRQSEDSDSFEDATEDLSDINVTNGHEPSANGSIRSSANSVRSHRDVYDIRAYTTEEIDFFAYSGIGMCWGIINLVLSVVPPVFRHLLALFNFKGDREYGIALLWSASEYKHNIFGAIAALCTNLYMNVAIGLTDIIPENAYPEERLKKMNAELRTLYPDSQLWRIEGSRITVNQRNLEQAAKDLEFTPSKPFPQLSGLRMFERSLNLMFLHRFEECATSFLETVKLNVWSHGMYYYIAAACHIELYRDCKASDPEKAKIHVEKAKEYLEPVPVLVKHKAIMGRQLPFDAFIDDKIAKWRARAAARNCDLLDCVGVSPIEELSYFWTGYRRMSPVHLETSLARLAACEQMPSWKDETTDEKAGLATLQGIALRFLGRHDEAMAKFQDEVFRYSAQQIKSCPNSTTYALPVAHYELACCIWEQSGGEKASWDELSQISDEVDICAKWEHWELEERMVAKIASAKETLARLMS